MRAADFFVGCLAGAISVVAFCSTIWPDFALAIWRPARHIRERFGLGAARLFFGVLAVVMIAIAYFLIAKSTGVIQIN